MTRPRGRPAEGTGVSREAILAAALALLDEGGGQGLSMRALAARLGVTPMSLYHHVGDFAGLLRALSDQVYAQVLAGAADQGDSHSELRHILVRYHAAVHRHPQLTLAIFAVPNAFAGVTRQITDRLTELLSNMTAHPHLWRDILVDHAHGSALPPLGADGDQDVEGNVEARYRQSLDCLLSSLVAP